MKVGYLQTVGIQLINKKVYYAKKTKLCTEQDKWSLNNKYIDNIPTDYRVRNEERIIQNCRKKQHKFTVVQAGTKIKL